jgi:hypothetical protein
VVVLTLISGCSSVTDSNRTADTAQVTVTGTSTVPLTLITSTRFTVQANDGTETVTLLVADTAVLELPIDRSVPFGDSDRFFVQLFNPDPVVDATVDMRVLVDGVQVYRQAAMLRDASLIFRYRLY